MPNHITSELTCENPTTLAAIRGGTDRPFIDFNAIISMPEILHSEPDSEVKMWAEIALGMINLTSSHRNPGDSFRDNDFGAASKALHQSNAIRALTDGPFPQSFTDKRFEEMITCMRCVRQYGHLTWLEWALENWGTKWNAYSQRSVNDTAIRFDTAWSAPLKVLSALSKKYPEETFRLRWADEDFGSNTGDVTFKNSEIIAGGRLEDNSREAYALVLELKCDGIVPEEYELIDGKLVYREEAEA
jgi:Api92-like protein with ferredoxin domain